MRGRLPHGSSQSATTAPPRRISSWACTTPTGCAQTPRARPGRSLSARCAIAGTASTVWSTPSTRTTTSQNRRSSQRDCAPRMQSKGRRRSTVGGARRKGYPTVTETLVQAADVSCSRPFCRRAVSFFGASCPQMESVPKLARKMVRARSKGGQQGYLSPATHKRPPESGGVGRATRSGRPVFPARDPVVPARHPMSPARARVPRSPRQRVGSAPVWRLGTVGIYPIAHLPAVRPPEGPGTAASWRSGPEART